MQHTLKFWASQRTKTYCKLPGMASKLSAECIWGGNVCISIHEFQQVWQTTEIRSIIKPGGTLNTVDICI